MACNVLSVLTFKSLQTVLEAGGTQSWALDRSRARLCKYAVVCRNAKHPGKEGNELHKHAFMVGIIKDVVPSTEMKDRWLVTFSEYATGDFGEQWEGRNPVAYYTTDDYKDSLDGKYKGIDFQKLIFNRMPDPSDEKRIDKTIGLTIAEAKRGLAQTFGVDPGVIEITIRG